MESLSSFIVVFNDLSSKIYSSKEIALKKPNIYIVGQQIVIDTFSTYNGDRKKFGFKIFNNEGKPADITLNGWIIKTETIENFYHTRNNLMFKMIDPMGEIREIAAFSETVTVSTAVDLCNYLQCYKNSSSWDYHELLLENQKLKERIAYLEQLSSEN